MNTLAVNSHQHRSSPAALAANAFPLLLTILVNVAFIVLTAEEGMLRTLALSCLVTVLGYKAISYAADSLSAPSVLKLSFVFSFKLLATSFLLYFGWFTDLDLSSSSYGYDPQRFYFDAYALASAGFDTRALPSINYAGILYYYACIFAVFGHNPIAPALINSFLTLVACLFVVAVVQKLWAGNRWTWLVGVGMILPEVLWYDAITCRETVCMSLLTIAVMAFMYSRLSERRGRARVRHQLLSFLSLFALGVVRPPMLIPCVAALGLINHLLPRSTVDRPASLAKVALLIAILAFVPSILEANGSYAFSYTQLQRYVVFADDDENDNFHWNSNSIGRRLAPNSSFEALLFLLPRAALYVATPLPNLGFSFDGLSDRYWAAWQSLCALLSSACYVLILPASLLSAFKSLSPRSERGTLVFHGCFFLVFLSIAANVIIHGRYRAMAALLFWASGCIGFGTAKKGELWRVYPLWGVVLMLLYAAYLFLKI